MTSQQNALSTVVAHLTKTASVLIAEANQKKAIIPEKERSAEEDESLVRSARQLKAQMNDRKSGERTAAGAAKADLCLEPGWSRG